MEQIDQSVSLSLDNVEAISAQIKYLALQCKDKPLEILHILRVLEQLHIDICSEIFQPALPNSRHALFDLLKEIEAEVGKELSYAVFASDDFIYRLNICDKFIRDVLDYPHQKILNKLGI